MIDTKELRRLAQAALTGFQKEANPATVIELLDRLEAVEKERDKLKELNSALCTNSNSQVIHNARLAEENYALRAENAALVDDMNLIRANNTSLRARIEAMEKQEPVWFIDERGEPKKYHKSKADYCKYGGLDLLYALPGAQPAPSVPEGWLRAIDEALVVAHIGVANASDTYEQAKAKLDNLIGCHVDVATDPAVNGGWRLVPIEPTPGMIDAAEYVDWGDADVRGSCINAWNRMLAAAPEVKP